MDACPYLAEAAHAALIGIRVSHTVVAGMILRLVIALGREQSGVARHMHLHRYHMRF